MIISGGTIRQAEDTISNLREAEVAIGAGSTVDEASRRMDTMWHETPKWFRGHQFMTTQEPSS